MFDSEGMIAYLIEKCKTRTQYEEEAQWVDVVTFEEESLSFLGMDPEMEEDAEPTVELSVVEYNGAMALCLDVKASDARVAMNTEAMLGENYEKLAKMSFDIGVELGPDGQFYAVSGKVYTVTGEDGSRTAYDWAIDNEEENPTTITITFDTENVPFTAGQGECLVLSKDGDEYAEADGFNGEDFLNVYISNICFYDAEENILPVNVAAQYSPAEEAAE